MLNQWLRYIPIARLVKNTGCKVTLEVGGGVKGINNYLSGIKVIGVDIQFQGQALPVAGKFIPVRGDARSLPFEDGAFKAVVCVDMLEHIASEDRRAVISELLRVSREKVILAFPDEEAYGRWEKRIMAMYRAMKKPLPDWLTDHMRHGLPRTEIIEKVLSDMGVSFIAISNENNLVHFVAMALDASPCSNFFKYIVDVMAPDHWEFGKRSIGQNMARIIFFPMRQLPGILNFGSTVRKIYVMSKI